MNVSPTAAGSPVRIANSQSGMISDGEMEEEDEIVMKIPPQITQSLPAANRQVESHTHSDPDLAPL